MAVRLFVGNLSYSTTEADLRTYFGTVAPPSQIVLPVDRETGRPRGFAFVEYIDAPRPSRPFRTFNGQVFNGRPLAVSEARAREDRGPVAPRPGGRWAGHARRRWLRPAARRQRRRIRTASAVVRRSAATLRSVGASAAPQPQLRSGREAAARSATPRRKKKEAERPRGPIPLKATGRSFTLDDDSPDDVRAGYRRHRDQQAARRDGRRISAGCMSSPDANLWNQILDRLREEVEPEEYRRWFSPTTYASDSGDLITVWVPTEATRRYISTHYTAHIERTLRVLRPHSAIRFVVTGVSDDEDEDCLTQGLSGLSRAQRLGSGSMGVKVS